MTDDTDPHDLVQEMLSGIGFPATRIDERPGQKTPDFRCATKDGDFVIELKARFDDPAEIAQRQVTLAAGKVHRFSQTVARRNTVSGIVSEACDQLRAWHDPKAFKIAWLHADLGRSHLKIEQFKSSLLGLATLFSMDLPHTTECLFFNHSDFFRFRADLDGAIVTRLVDQGTRVEGAFYLNSFAARYSTLKTCALPRAFGRALYLPDEKEEPPEMLIADCNIDRKDRAAMLRYLCSKYGLKHLQGIDLAYHEGTVSTDHPVVDDASTDPLSED